MSESAPKPAAAYPSRKDRLPRGWAYPLKRSVLDAALDASGITEIFTVTYSAHPTIRHDNGEPVFEPFRVSYGGLGRRSYASGLFSIVVNAVPVSHITPVGRSLHASLPDICAWMRTAREASETWRMRGGGLRARWSEDTITLLETDPM